MEWAEIGQRVEDRRIEMDLTQGQAATAAGVGVSTWANLENARADSYSRAVLRKVCKTLGWPANQIAVWRGDEVETNVEPAQVPTDINPGAARRFDALEAKLDRMEAMMAKLVEGAGPARRRAR